MKRQKSVFLILVLLFVLTSCGRGDTYELELPPVTPSPTPLIIDEPELEDYEIAHESSIPLDEAARFIRIMQDVFDEDGGALWGIDLSAPFMFVDPVTRHAVANRPDNQGNLVRQGDVYVGILSDRQRIGNTIAHFGGVLWGMALWTNSEEHNDSDMVRIMIHEVFHVKQEVLIVGTPQGTGLDFFSDSARTRTLIRLELGALLRAITSETETERLSAITDALSIRNERVQRGRLTREDREMEIHEGTAYYTDLMLGFNNLDERIHAIEELAENISRLTATYIFGALYGFLLDDFSVNWKYGIRYTTNLGDLLQEAAGIEELIPFEELNLEAYGYTEIVSQETERAEISATRRRSTRESFAEQPVLRISGMGDFSDYNFEILFMPDLGMIYYGNIVFTNIAGTLKVHDGPFLLQGMEYEIPVKDITIEESRAFGHNWELELNDGFEMVEDNTGDFIVRRIGG